MADEHNDCHSNDEEGSGNEVPGGSGSSKRKRPTSKENQQLKKKFKFCRKANVVSIPSKDDSSHDEEFGDEMGPTVPEERDSGVQSIISPSNSGAAEDHLPNVLKYDLTQKDLFCLRLWKLFPSKAAVDEIMISDDDVKDLQQLLAFLQGKTVQLSTEDFIKFLKSAISTRVSSFVYGVLMVHYVQSLPTVAVRRLYSVFKEVPAQFQDLFTVLVAYFSSTFTKLEGEGNNLQKNDIAILLEPKRSRAELANKAGIYLLRLINTELYSESPPQSDMFYSKEDRLAVWNAINLGVMNNITMKDNKNIFDLVISVYRYRLQDSKMYFKIYNNGSLIPVHLHPELINNKEAIPSSTTVIAGTEKEVRDMIKIISSAADPIDDSNERLTINVYRMLLFLKVPNLTDILFRGDILKKTTPPERRVDLLKICIHLGKQRELKIIASNFSTWLAPEYRNECLNGVSEAGLQDFLSYDNLDVEEIDVYQIIVSWTLDVMGRRQDILADVETRRVFQSAAKPLRLLHLRPYFKRIVSSGYITKQDVLNLDATASQKRSEQENWFSFKPPRRQMKD